MLDFNGSGMSVMELSHRSATYSEVHTGFINNLRDLLSIPKNYDILLMQGGASLQFSTVVYNLVDFSGTDEVAYVVTGTWSDKAATEAEKILGSKNRVHRLVDTSDSNHNGNILAASNWNWPKTAPKYVYYCDNETVHGVEFPSFPFSETSFLPDYFNGPNKPLIVCDMSSNFASRKINVENFDLIFAGAQKNIGPAGLTVVIIKSDLLEKHSVKQHIPLMMDFKLMKDNDSLYNTPPCFAIYMSGLILKWALKNGGIEWLERRNKEKAQILYDYLIQHPTCFKLAVVKEEYRSKMNIPFRIIKDGVSSEALEKEFVKMAESNGMVQLAGHRSVGGIRVSLYNAMELEGVQRLLKLLEDFRSNKLK